MKSDFLNATIARGNSGWALFVKREAPSGGELNYNHFSRTVAVPLVRFCEHAGVTPSELRRVADRLEKRRG